MASVSGGDAAGFATGAALDATYGAGTAERVRAAKVLVVGAGGVGCELVKNLACTGFASITLIDLDTVDVSNLNRQFLFRRHHVGKSKAVEAAASVNRMVPGTLVEGLMGDVKETRFDVSFFKGFHLVCNALDNLEARRHVNRMCLAAEVPLVESGSTGFNGNVSVIGKGVECYDCIEKMPQKSYAVCTIRSTPDKPVHCVVWAKFLFDLIFGPDDDGNVLKDLDGVAPAEPAADRAASSGTARKGPDPPAAAKGRHNDDKNYNLVEPANVHMDDDGAEGEEGHRVSKSSADASKTRRSSRDKSDAVQGPADVQMTDSQGEKIDASAMDPDAAAAAEGRQNDDKDYVLVEPANVYMDDDGEGGDSNAAVLKSNSSPATRGRRTSGAKSGAADESKVRTRNDGTGKKGGAAVMEPDAAAATLGRLNHDKNYVVVEPSNVYMDDDGDDSENDATATKPSTSTASGKGQRTKGAKHETTERRSLRTRNASKGKKPINPAMEPNPAAAALGRLNHDKNYVVVEPSNVYMDDDGEDGVNEAAIPEPSDSGAGRELRTRGAKRAATERKNVPASADNKERKRESSVMEPDAAAAAEGRLNDDKNYVVVEPSNVYMDDDGEDGFNPAAKREPGIRSVDSKQHSTKVAKHEATEDASAHRGGKGKGRKTEDSPMDPDAAAAAEGRLNDDKNYLLVEPSNVYMDDDGEDGVNEAAKPEPGTTTAGAHHRTRSAKRTTTRRGDGHAGDVKKETEDDKSAMDPDAAAAAEGRLNDDKNYLLVEPSNVYMDDDGEDGVNEAAKPEPGAAPAGSERRTKNVRRTSAEHANASAGGSNKEMKDGSSAMEPDAAAAARGRRRGDKDYVVVEPSNVYMDDDGEDGFNEAAKPESGATDLAGERRSRSTRSTAVGHGEARRSGSTKESKKDHSAMDPDAAAAAEGRLNNDENYVVVEPSNVYMDDDGEDGMNEAAMPKPAAAGADSNRQSRKGPKTGKAGPASARAGGEDDGKTAEGSPMDPDAAAAAEGRLNHDKNYVVVEPSNVYMDDDGEDGGEYGDVAKSGATAAASTRRQGKSARQTRADVNTNAGNKGKKTENSAMDPDAAAAAEGRQDGDENYVLVEPSNVYMDDDGEDGVNSAAEPDPSTADAQEKRRSEKAQPKAAGGSTPRRSEAGKEGTTGKLAMEPDAAAAARGRLNDDANYKVVEPANVHMDDDGEIGRDGATVATSGTGKRSVDRPRDKHSPRGVRQVDGEDVETFASRVCHRVFVEDIESQIAMKDLWTERSPPLVYDVSAAASRFQEDLDKVDLLDQVAWTKERSAGVFKGVLQKIATTRRSDIGTLTFDKDDRDAMMFVTAASNLRSHAYGVPLQAPFTVKGIAGNIIHAVATTNAVVGGLVVLEALKIISNQGGLKDSKISYVCKAPMGNRSRKIINPTQLRSPKQKCFVCSSGQLRLSIDVAHATLRTLVFEVLKSKLGVLQPTVELSAGGYYDTLYECGDGLEEDEAAEYAANLDRTLSSLRVHAGSQLTIKDFAQDLTFTLHVSDAAGRFDDRAPTERFSLDGDLPQNSAFPKADDQDVDDVDDEVEEVAVADAGAQKAKAVVAMTKVVKTTKVTKTVTTTISGAAVPRKRGLAGDADETAAEGPSAKKARSDGAV